MIADFVNAQFCKKPKAILTPRSKDHKLLYIMAVNSCKTETDCVLIIKINVKWEMDG